MRTTRRIVWARVIDRETRVSGRNGWRPEYTPGRRVGALFTVAVDGSLYRLGGQRGPMLENFLSVPDQQLDGTDLHAINAELARLDALLGANELRIGQRHQGLVVVIIVYVVAGCRTAIGHL